MKKFLVYYDLFGSMEVEAEAEQRVRSRLLAAEGELFGDFSITNVEEQV